MASAFKLLPAAGVTPEGEYGTSVYGVEVYGGTGSTFTFVLPVPQLGSDVPWRADHREAGRTEHRRAGILLARRTWKQVGRWIFEYRQKLTGDEGASFRRFFDAGTFLFRPDTADESTSYVVAWVGNTFRLIPERNGKFSLSFAIEEVA